MLAVFFIPVSNIFGQANKETATVYFMRTIGNFSASGAMNIFVDSAFQCKLNESRYFTRNYDPGVHLFSVQAQGKKYKKRIEQIPLELEAGKTYYLQLAVMYDTFVNYLYLKEVTKNTANLVMPRLIPDASCAK
ncbi:MAG: DUF2846 domain-containing protein [Gloeobacteraceae cyanobacterium ES-bin-316]|nr:DUF2846 domain-containing protein [Ferruginibacter sp.]